MKFTTYNIHYGVGLDGQFGVDRILDFCRDADVIALQEVDRFLPRNEEVDMVREIALQMSGYHWVYGAGVDIDADQILEDGSIHHRRRQFGNMLLSRTPIITARKHLLPKYASIGALSIQRIAVEGVIACGDTRIRVYSLHLTHISKVERMQQVKRLLRINRDAVAEGGPVSGKFEDTDFEGQGGISELPREAIMMGDFNFVPDSKEYDRIVGPISDYGGRVTNPTGFVDAWVEAGNSEEQGYTGDVKGKEARLDYCFVSQPLANRIRSARIDTEAIGSDHKPLTVEFDFSD